MRCARIPLLPLIFIFVAASMLLAGGLLAGGQAFAKDDVDPDSYRSFDVGGGLVTLDVQDATLGEVIRERIQPRTRVNIQVAPAAADLKVTLRVVDLHWVLTLDALVENIGGFMVRRAPNLLKIERPKPITIAFDDENIRTVIHDIATYAGASVVVSPKVEGTITLNLNEVPWDAALRLVVRTVGKYTLVEESFGMFSVLPRDELELETDYYRFRYMRPPPVYRGVMATTAGGTGASSDSSGGSGAGGGGGGGGGLIYDGDPYKPTDDPATITDYFPIIKALQQIVDGDDGGSVMYDPQQNAIVFRGTKPRIRKLKAMVSQLDVEPPQVFIDMNFVVTSNNDALDLGLKAGESSFGAGLSGADILHALPFNAGSGTGLADALTGTAFPSPASSAFSYGTLSTSQTSLLWNALQRDSSSRIVQAPKLLALDNQAATLFIGDTVRYARTTAATNQNGGLQFSVEEDPNSPVSVGFQLLVIPHVVPGEDKIRMTVIPERRALTGTGPLPGFDRINVSGQFIDLPRVKSSTLVTHMILRDKQTAVIGGLLEDRSVERADKIPFLGDLPFGGLLFQGKGTTTVKEHLLITITPTIIKGTDAVNPTITDELEGRDRKVATEWSDLEGRAARWPGMNGTSAAAKTAPAAPASVPLPPAPAVRESVPVAPGR